MIIVSLLVIGAAIYLRSSQSDPNKEIETPIADNLGSTGSESADTGSAVPPELKPKIPADAEEPAVETNPENIPSEPVPAAREVRVEEVPDSNTPIAESDSSEAETAEAAKETAAEAEKPSEVSEETSKPSSKPSQEPQEAMPSDIEQDVLAAHNRLRADPGHFIKLIEDDMKYFESDGSGGTIRKGKDAVGLTTQEGKPAYLEAVEALKEMTAGELPEFR
jgi:hypothetical protein